ncbi:MAG: Lon protease family protein, partial [Chloroflexota bacterium]
DEYKAQRKSMLEEGQARQQAVFADLRAAAQQQGFLIQTTATGAALVPLKDGKSLSQEEFLALGEEERKEIESRRNAVRKEMEKAFEQAQDIERSTTERLQTADLEVAENTASRLFKGLMEKYARSERISRYLQKLKTYTLENLDLFKGEQEEKPETVLGLAAVSSQRGSDRFLPFSVNLFVDNSEVDGPPTVVETNPNFVNLFGKMERRFVLGGYVSDHTMLKPGAFQTANGGYLLLSAADVLSNTAVWPTLKRVLKTGELAIEEPFEQLGLITPQGMRPHPMPMDVKVILIGDSMLYQLLSTYDEDFWEVFKVKADFDYQVDRTEENIRAYAAFIAGCCEESGLRHFDRTGVAAVIEHAARVVSNQSKVSSRFAYIKEVVQESEHWARQANAMRVSAIHVTKAIEESRFRHNLPDERVREMIEDGTILIDTQGAVVGQVNGLSVYSWGDIMFGKPSRITCRTYLGRGGVINIEREVNLSGSSHDKGIMILSGYIGWKFAQDHPLSLSASLCFEQSYGGVDGDSASCAELYALLSSLSGVPLRQDLAVTGSVDQRGQVQPIGGVNQKIEGFFQVCRTAGLTGTQGVVIPRRNLHNLMLRDEVIDAVRSGTFHIYAVDDVDEGISIMTGMSAGRMRKDGSYPARSVNGLAVRQLKAMAGRLRAYYGQDTKFGKGS